MRDNRSEIAILPRKGLFGAGLDPMPLQVADDTLEPGPGVVQIRLVRADVHHRDCLGTADERQRVMERPIGFARSVPGDEYPCADAREGAGLGRQKSLWEKTSRNPSFRGNRSAGSANPRLPGLGRPIRDDPVRGIGRHRQKVPSWLRAPRNETIRGVARRTAILQIGGFQPSDPVFTH